MLPFFNLTLQSKTLLIRFKHLSCHLSASEEKSFTDVTIVSPSLQPKLESFKRDKTLLNQKNKKQTNKHKPCLWVLRNHFFFVFLIYLLVCVCMCVHVDLSQDFPHVTHSWVIYNPNMVVYSDYSVIPEFGNGEVGSSGVQGHPASQPTKQQQLQDYF